MVNSGETQPKQSYQQLLQKKQKKKIKKRSAWRATDCRSALIWYWNDRLHVCMLGVCVNFFWLLSQKDASSEQFVCFYIYVTALRGRRSFRRRNKNKKRHAFILKASLWIQFAGTHTGINNVNEFCPNGNNKWDGLDPASSLTSMFNNVTTAWTMKTTYVFCCCRCCLFLLLQTTFRLWLDVDALWFHVCQLQSHVVSCWLKKGDLWWWMLGGSAINNTGLYCVQNE